MRGDRVRRVLPWEGVMLGHRAQSAWEWVPEKRLSPLSSCSSVFLLRQCLAVEEASLELTMVSRLALSCGGGAPHHSPVLEVWWKLSFSKENATSKTRF